MAPSYQEQSEERLVISPPAGWLVRVFGAVLFLAGVGTVGAWGLGFLKLPELEGNLHFLMILLLIIVPLSGLVVLGAHAATIVTKQSLSKRQGLWFLRFTTSRKTFSEVNFVEIKEEYRPGQQGRTQLTQVLYITTDENVRLEVGAGSAPWVNAMAARLSGFLGVPEIKGC